MHTFPNWPNPHKETLYSLNMYPTLVTDFKNHLYMTFSFYSTNIMILDKLISFSKFYLIYKMETIMLTS